MYSLSKAYSLSFRCYKMGNTESSPANGNGEKGERGFPGSALLENMNIQCGSINDTDDSSPKKGGAPKTPTTNGTLQKIFNQAETLCAQSPTSTDGGAREYHDDLDFEDDDESIVHNGGGSEPKSLPSNPTSALLARALVSEVTDNPKNMTSAAMADREKKLLKAQEKARQHVASGGTGPGGRPVGTPGGVGQTSVLSSIAHALTGDPNPMRQMQGSGGGGGIMPSILPPNALSENRAQVNSGDHSNQNDAHGTNNRGKHTITIGLSLSRRHSIGHPDTVTRQTAFDFNELQDRQYKYVSSTDSSGWRAGGGERGGPLPQATPTNIHGDDNEGEMFGTANTHATSQQQQHPSTPTTPQGAKNYKIAAPDAVHIPIIHIDAESPQQVDFIIAALARGEIFIPHMAVLPEALSVNGISPPDLVVRFGTERNDDVPPDDWPNWCLEFMHNQLYEYFYTMGARWTKRPFSITLAKKVRWKTVKHMNRYFAHAERVIDAWREKGPQYLDPQLAYIEGGATPEEVARPHGIYLLRNGVPTNYFAPNFDPPYTTKMTRSLLLNVLGKSWDKRRREWTSEPIPRLVTPTLLISTMCGCSDNTTGGFMASEATISNKIDTSTIPENAIIRSDSLEEDNQSYPMLNNKPLSLPQKTKQRIQDDYGDQSRDPVMPQPQKSKKMQDDYSDSSRDPVAKTTVKLAVSVSASSSLEESAASPPLSNQEPETSPTRRRLDPDDASNQGPSTGFLLEEQGERGQDESPSMSLDDEFEGWQLSEDTSANSKSLDQDKATPNASKYSRAPSPETRRRHLETQNEQDDEADTSANTSRDPDTSFTDAGQPSVAGTNSTIMHMNLSSAVLMERRQAREEKKEEPQSMMACDDDWLDDQVRTIIMTITTIHWDTAAGLVCWILSFCLLFFSVRLTLYFQGRPVPSPNTTALLERRRKHKEKKDAKEKDRARKITLIAMAQEETIKARQHLAKTLNDPGKMELANAVMQSTNKKINDQEMLRNGSGVSLDYSNDSGLMGENSTMGGSALMGQQFATDGSVMSTTSRGSRARMMGTTTKKDDDTASAFSLQESTSSLDQERVPTDEELFRLGWAKARDPKSGSYYYFTLDRTKIVWENPLVSHSIGASSESMDMPLGSAAI